MKQLITHITETLKPRLIRFDTSPLPPSKLEAGNARKDRRGYLRAWHAKDRIERRKPPPNPDAIAPPTYRAQLARERLAKGTLTQSEQHEKSRRHNRRSKPRRDKSGRIVA